MHIDSKAMKDQNTISKLFKVSENKKHNDEFKQF
jgi:hypothetical protein